MRFVLASGSPRRRELLEAAGQTFDVDAADVDETRRAGEPPAAYVERLARLKAETVAARHPGRLVLGADTIVVLGDEVLGKPSDPRHAASMLRQLSGRAHDVLTAVAVASERGTRSRVERTTVHVAQLSDADVSAYVATGEPMDKAGGYAIQGGASRFVTRIAGAYDTVVGLPVVCVLQLLRDADAP